MKRILTLLSLIATFGGLLATIGAFAVFCWLCLQPDGAEMLLSSTWGVGVLVAFVCGVLTGLAGVAGLLVVQHTPMR